MNVSGMSSGMQQVQQSAQAMNEILKMAVSADQELSGKLVKAAVASKVSGGELGSKLDITG